MRYLFEEYAFDTDRRELHRGTDIVSVAPQVFDLLDYLIRNREHVVSKDDLINAIWNGRIVSDAALTTRLNAARSAICDSGEEQRLIKTLPRKGFRFVGTVREAKQPASVAVSDTPAQRPKPALPLLDKPSVAVLPFTNLSSDPEQDYFADGMVEDITAALSHFKSLFVIARNSSFTYKGKAVDIKQVGRELGVRYVLEGSVRKAGDRVRIAGQLIEATTGAHLWADKFDGGFEDVFELQDAVTERVVGALEASVQQAEIDRARTKPTNNLDAYDCYLRALPLTYQLTREGTVACAEYLKRAIMLDPEYGLAKALLAYSHLVNFVQGWGTESDRASSVALSQDAITNDPDNPLVLRMAGMCLGYFQNYDRSLTLLEKAFALNPNVSTVLRTFGWVECFACVEPDLAIAHFERSMRLNPRDPEVHITLGGIAYAHLIAGRNKQALTFAQRSIDEVPHFTAGLRAKIAALGSLDRWPEAKAAAANLLSYDPQFTIARAPVFRDQRFQQKYRNALKASGLSE